jgi:hypothetical protein
MQAMDGYKSAPKFTHTLIEVMTKPKKPRKPLDFYRETVAMRVAADDKIKSTVDHLQTLKKWKTMSTEERKEFEEMSAQDMERHQQELKQYNQLMAKSLTVGQMVELMESSPFWTGSRTKTRTKAQGSQDLPKAPKNAFWCFCEKRRADIKAQKGKPVTAVALGKEWKALSMSERVDFERMASNEKAQWKNLKMMEEKGFDHKQSGTESESRVVFKSGDIET